MKILKITIVVIVVILAATLLTLRVTGLEPEYLDFNALRAHHMIARPGFWIKGDLVTTPVTDWSFVGLVLIADRTQAIAILGKNPENMEKGPDGQEHVESYDHIFRAFQRNIPEYGGDQLSASSAGLVPQVIAR